MTTIRPATDADRAFILSLSPALAEVARLSWHTPAAVQAFQDAYIAEMLDDGCTKAATLIADLDGQNAGFLHIRERMDEISGEAAATIPLLAVSSEARGQGIGVTLMRAAEKWACARGYRLLHLEVFANNETARDFYRGQGFQEETLAMIKPLTA